MLRLQRYDLNITYKPGKEMYVADTLSRATSSVKETEIQEQEEILKIHVTTFMNNLPIAEREKGQLREHTDRDPQF